MSGEGASFLGAWSGGIYLNLDSHLMPYFTGTIREYIETLFGNIQNI